MTDVTTIQVPTELRDRLKRAKDTEGRTYVGLLNWMLDMYENGGI